MLQLAEEIEKILLKIIILTCKFTRNGVIPIPRLYRLQFGRV